MKSQLLFCSVPYKLTDIRLGTLVADPTNPLPDSLTALEAKEDVDYSKRGHGDFTGALDAEETLTWMAQITRLLKISKSKSESQTLNVEAREGSLYELKDPKIFFRLCCAEPKTRQWLREGLQQGDDAFFVVALRTFVDASIGGAAREEKSLQVEGDAPVGDAVKANTGVSPGDAADLKGSVSRTSVHGDQAKFSLEGERVLGLCYRRVTVSKRKSISEAELGKPHIWKMFTGQRDRTRDDTAPAGEEEFYEADMEDLDMTSARLADNIKLVFESDQAALFETKEV